MSGYPKLSRRAQDHLKGPYQRETGESEGDSYGMTF